MRVTYIVCPTCRTRKTLKREASNTRNYEEHTEYVPCIKCRTLPATPEQRLLDALFGEKEVTYG